MAVLSTMLLCSGCESPTELSTGQGVGQLHYVAFTGPGDKLTERTYADTMLRAAQIAKNHNKPYFLMYESLDSAALNIPARMPRAGVLHGRVMVSAFILLLDQPAPAARTTTAVLTEFGSAAQTGTPR